MEIETCWPVSLLLLAIMDESVTHVFYKEPNCPKDLHLKIILVAVSSMISQGTFSFIQNQEAKRIFSNIDVTIDELDTLALKFLDDCKRVKSPIDAGWTNSTYGWDENT